MQSTLQGTLTEATFWAATPSSLSDPVVGQLRALIEADMAVDSAEIPSHRDRDGVLLLRGRLLRPSDQAFAHWLAALKVHGYVPLLRSDAVGGPDAVTVRILIDAEEQGKPRIWINSLLFVLTVFSTLFVGALYNVHQDQIRLRWEMLSPEFLLTGLPFAATLLGILAAHELGHYIAAQYHKVAVTLPYFIPMPLTIGTYGAFIRLRDKVADRRKLFDIGVAGPLAGLALALPLFLYGLATSPIGLPEINRDFSVVGDSIFFYTAKLLLLGRMLPDPVTGEIVIMNPILVAALIGLLVTVFNLLPLGQLDGGHMVFAMFGERAKIINRMTVGVAFLLALASCAPVQSLLPALAGVGYGGWLYWLVFALSWAGLQHPPVLDNITPLDRRRWLVGALVVLIFVLIFAPIPAYKLQRF